MKHRTSILALAACGLAFSVLLFLARGFVHLGVPHFHPELKPFTDTRAHLETAAGCRAGLGEWQGSACFVPDAVTVPRAQTYQPWLFLYDIGLLPYQHYTTVAWVMLVLFWLAYARLASPSGPRELLLALLLAHTAAIQLCVQRGNFDLLVFTLMAGAAMALARPGRTGFVLGTGALALATALKLYTGAATALSWLAARQWHWRAAAVSAVLLAIAVAIVGPAEIHALGQEAPEGATRFSTGVPWLRQYLGTHSTAALVTLAMVTAGAACWRNRYALRAGLAALPVANRIGLHLSAFSAVPLYMFKASYDYRFVIWLPAVLCLLKLSGVHAGRAIGWTGLGLFLLAAGMELPLHWIEPWGRTVLDFTAPGPVQWLVLAKQCAALALAALVACLSLLDLGTPRRTAPVHPPVA